MAGDSNATLGPLLLQIAVATETRASLTYSQMTFQRVSAHRRFARGPLLVSWGDAAGFALKELDNPC
jgi:hypothetical protein